MTFEDGEPNLRQLNQIVLWLRMLGTFRSAA
jgi:hypothetical protein